VSISAVLAPFAEFAFLRRALAACLALSLSYGPLGVVLVLRRMSLMGDALSHAILPGAALGFVMAGFSFAAMGLGGLIAGLVVAVLSGILTRTTPLEEDASLAALYLVALAVGVLLVANHGTRIDLLHILFGTVLAVGPFDLVIVAAITTGTLMALALVYRPLVVECFDPGFLYAVRGGGAFVHLVFLGLVIVNLVAGFYCLGALMAVGLMMAPAATARFWARRLGTQWLVSATVAFASCLSGLLLSYHARVPAGPGIVLMAGGFYLISVCFGPYDSLRARYLVRSHRQA